MILETSGYQQSVALSDEVGPQHGLNTGNAGNENQGANAQNCFTQLAQENQQINVFIDDWTLEHAAEEEAEARHRMMVDVIYTEASMHIRSVEAHADAEHTRRLAFVLQGTHVLVPELNTEMTAYRAEAEQFQSRLLRSETDCHEERQAALRLTLQNMSHSFANRSATTDRRFSSA